MRNQIILTAFCCAVYSVAAAQNLREVARANGGRVSNTFDAHFGVPAQADLMKDADLVLRAKVIDAQASLSFDGTYVVTDVVLAPITVFRQRQPTRTNTPGQSTTIVARRPGGHVIEGELDMTTAVDAYPESESLKVGEDVIAFLIYNEQSRVFNFVAGPFGAFRIRSNHVEAVTREAARRRHDVSVEVSTFVTELNRLAREAR